MGIAASVVELTVRRQINGHALRRACIARGVGARATIQSVSTTRAFQRVVAQAAAQLIGLHVTGQLVVIRTAHQMLDVGQHITLGIAAFVDGIDLQ